MAKFHTLYYVVPWYGPEAGGAEYHAHLLCQTFVKQGVNVEVLTTCSRDVGSSWYKDAVSPGSTVIEGVPVHRFPVRSGTAREFHELNSRLINGLMIGARESEIFLQNSINSDELMTFVAEHAADNAFVFMPYQYGTSVLGSRIAPERSFLIPCLHDEPIAYLSPVRDMFRRMRGILFSTPPEAALAGAIYGLPPGRPETFGVGIHEDFSAEGGRFREKYKIDVPYILCIGRKDPGKNVYYLVNLFSHYLKETGTEIALVMIGPGKLTDIPRNAAHHVMDIGFVSEQEKRDACAGAEILIQPSNRESFSMVIMESWLAGVPVIVNGHCAVTRWLVSAANGGLYFDNYYEFRECLDLLLKDFNLKEQLGEQGKAFITKHYRWDDIATRAVHFIEARL